MKIGRNSILKIVKIGRSLRIYRFSRSGGTWSKIAVPGGMSTRPEQHYSRSSGNQRHPSPKSSPGPWKSQLAAIDTRCSAPLPFRAYRVILSLRLRRVFFGSMCTNFCDQGLLLKRLITTTC